MSRLQKLLFFPFLFLLPCFFLFGVAPRAALKPLAASLDKKARSHILDSYGNLPLWFEPNEGQADPQVKFLARGGGYALYLTPAEAVFVMNRRESNGKTKSKKLKSNVTLCQPHQPEVLRLRLSGGNRKAVFEGMGKMEGLSHYFMGADPSHWRMGVAQYSKIMVRGVYPGIDMAYYGNQKKLEYDFVVAPGADPGLITFHPRGYQTVRVDRQGNLVFGMARENMRFGKPVLYQEQESIVKGGWKTIKTLVEGRYTVKEDGLIGFEVGAYDKSRSLVIDPPLFYSTYLGGSGDDKGNAIAVDSSGNAYVTGQTNGSFPTSSGAYQTIYGGGSDAVFVAKLNASGTTLLYSTYLGGSGDDYANGIAVDGSGNVYVTGQTTSGNFPTTSGAAQTLFGGSTNGFVTKLNAAGSSLLYSTYLGGDSDNYAQAIAIDGTGNAYVTGQTTSGDFPTTSGAAQTVFGGDQNVFVVKLNASGTAPVYSTYLGGSGADYAYGIALDGSQNAYVTGSTNSTDFPTTNGAYQSVYGGGSDAVFVAKLNSSGTTFSYSTYLGGSVNDNAFGIAVDGSGNAYITGSTSGSFPTTGGAYQETFNTNAADNAFVAELNSAGTILVYSTYIGGSVDDYAQGIAVDSSGNAYVTGTTASTDFPITGDAYQTSYAGNGYAVFVSELNSAGSTLVYSTYLSGSPASAADDQGNGIAVDSAGGIYVAGYTGGGFATTSGAAQTVFGGIEDAFAAKLYSAPTPTPTNTVTATPTFTMTNTITETSSSTATNTATNTSTETPVNTATNTGTNTETLTATDTPTNSATNSSTNTPTFTTTNTSSNTFTDTPSNTATNTGTNSATPTATDSPTNTPTSSTTNTPTFTATNTSSNTFTDTPSNTATNTGTNSATPTATDSPTNTPTSSTTNTPTFTATNTSSNTFTDTPSNTATNTGTNSATQTPTPTPTVNQTATAAGTATAQMNATATQQANLTQTEVTLLSETPTFTSTFTPTPTSTPTLTSTVNQTATAAGTATAQANATFTAQANSTATEQANETATAQANSTATQQANQTATVAGTATSQMNATATQQVNDTATAQANATSTAQANATATQQANQTQTEVALLSETPTFTSTFTPTPTSTPTLTATMNQTATAVGTATAQMNATATQQANESATAQANATSTAQANATATEQANGTATAQANATATQQANQTQTEVTLLSETPTTTPTPTFTITSTETFTDTSTITNTATQSPTSTTTNSPTSTPSWTVTSTQTETFTPNGTLVFQETATAQANQTATEVWIQSQTPTFTPTITSTGASTATPTVDIPLALGANEFKDLTDPPLRIDYWVENSGSVQIRIYSAVDLLVRHLASLNQAAGAYTIYWDGRDDTGAPLASGLYLVAVFENQRVEIKKVLVFKQ